MELTLWQPGGSRLNLFCMSSFIYLQNCPHHLQGKQRKKNRDQVTKTKHMEITIAQRQPNPLAVIIPEDKTKEDKKSFDGKKSQDTRQWKTRQKALGKSGFSPSGKPYIFKGVDWENATGRSATRCWPCFLAFVVSQRRLVWRRAETGESLTAPPWKRTLKIIKWQTQDPSAWIINHPHARAPQPFQYGKMEFWLDSKTLESRFPSGLFFPFVLSRPLDVACLLWRC